MARGPILQDPPSQQQHSWRRTHDDVGILDTRLTNTERAVENLANRVENNQRETQASIAANQREMLATISASQDTLSLKIDRNAAKPTNLLQLGGFMVAALSVVGGFAWYAKSGIDTDILRVETNLRIEEQKREAENDKIYLTLAPIAAVAAQHTSDLSAAAAQQSDNLRQFKAIEVSLDSKWSRDAQGEYEKRIDQNIDGLSKIVALEHEYDQRDFDRLLGRVNVLDGELIKRPEIEAIDNGLRNQITTIGGALEDVRKEIGSAYTWGDELKSMRSQIETLSGRIFGLSTAPTIAPIAPIAPLAPVAPAK
jgi:hypothetical protein